MAVAVVDLQNLLLGRTLPTVDGNGVQLIFGSDEQQKPLPALTLVMDVAATDSIWVCEALAPRKDDDSANWNLLTDSDANRALYAVELKPGERLPLSFSNRIGGRMTALTELFLVSKNAAAVTNVRLLLS